MRILKADKGNQNVIIAETIKTLKQGGFVVYPTETAYGLGADFLNPEAVKKIYKIKGRDYKKPLSVLVSSMAMARKYVAFDKMSLELVKKYWPGALTIITNCQFPISNKFQISNNQQTTINKQHTLGLRISSNKLATAIVRKFGRPITSTSANISGKNECFSAEDVIRQFSPKGGPASGWRNKKYQPDLIIDAGRLPKKQMSTIVKVIDGQLEVIRQGDVKISNPKFPAYAKASTGRQIPNIIQIKNPN